MTLSQKIAHLRDSKRISKADMAKALEMDFSNYHRLENRGEKLTLEQIDKIAGALEVTRDYLLNYDPTENPSTEDRYPDTIKEAVREEIKALKKRIYELEDVNSILKEYIETLKSQKMAVQFEFERVIEFCGEDAGLGTRNVTEETRYHLMYNMSFTESEFDHIIELIFKEKELYGIFTGLLMNGVLDPSREETKALQRHFTKRKAELAELGRKMVGKI